MERCSRSAWHRGIYLAAAIVGLGATLCIASGTARAQAPTPTPISCVGDCNGDHMVTVDEIITMVNIALGLAPITDCPAADVNGDGMVTVDELQTAIVNALNGCPAAGGVCGDGHVDMGEDCDPGGTCIGGTNAGTACTAESQCMGNGVCVGGAKTLVGCTANSDCPGGSCVHCKTFGGSGCAANCTSETTVPYNFVPGVAQGLGIMPGTSGAVVNGEILTIPLPLTGNLGLVIGKQLNGQIPGVIKLAGVNIPKIPVQTIACACIHPVEYKTCSGTLLDADGVTITPSCTDGFATPPVTCPAERPCTSVFGAGNTASGTIGCTSLTPVNLDWSQDCNGTPGGMPGSPVIALSGTGPAGSAIVYQALAIGTVVGACDMFPTFCTDADPPAMRGTPLPLINTTGAATGTVKNANDFPGFDIGPFSNTGTAFSCTALASGSTSGANLVSTFTACDQATVQDIVVVNQFVGQ